MRILALMLPAAAVAVLLAHQGDHLPHPQMAVVTSGAHVAAAPAAPAVASVGVAPVPAAAPMAQHVDVRGDVRATVDASVALALQAVEQQLADLDLQTAEAARLLEAVGAIAASAAASVDADLEFVTGDGTTLIIRADGDGEIALDVKH
jgi:hypothetical protein